MDFHQQTYFNFIFHLSSMYLTVLNNKWGKKISLEPPCTATDWTISHTGVSSGSLQYSVPCRAEPFSQGFCITSSLLISLWIAISSFRAFKWVHLPALSSLYRSIYIEYKENTSVYALRRDFYLFFTNIQLHFGGFSWLNDWILSIT